MLKEGEIYRTLENCAGISKEGFKHFIIKLIKDRFFLNFSLPNRLVIRAKSLYRSIF